MDRVARELHLHRVHEKNITGENIGVAIVDTGIRPHPDFVLPQNRIVGFFDALSGKTIPYEDSGHGTHVAGIIGGNGYLSGGRYIGMAPKCNFIIVKVLNSKGDGFCADNVAGLKQSAEAVTFTREPVNPFGGLPGVWVGRGASCVR